ncbi:MAG: hypothetical protein WCF33_21535 [Pseudonocardiaceae bacterium]
MRRNTLAIVDNVTELGELGLVADATAEAWVHRAAPLFKLYLINNEEVFFGFYPVREHIISLGGEPRTIYDVMGKDAILFHHSTTDDDTSTGDEKIYGQSGIVLHVVGAPTLSGLSMTRISRPSSAVSNSVKCRRNRVDAGSIPISSTAE